MITIVEPRELIDRLWGKQRIREADTYRLMRYVLRVDHEDKVLLHNAVTGRLAVLEPGEAEALESLPAAYSPVMEQLATEHFLVPESYDEHQQAVNLRNILHQFDVADVGRPVSITRYTILPTTACNARCYYCYERGMPAFTMTEQIADDTVKFIADHCGEKKNVSIRWFGGEPTAAAHRIDQICRGLQSKGIQYASSITTNGYLFDEEMASRAKALWNLKDAMICVDGTEKNYNEIKAFVNVKDNPYQRVMRNIGLLLEQGVRVELRMNFDLGNYRDFKDILEEARKRFRGSRLLQVHVFPVKGEYPDKNGRILHGSEAWFDEKIPELNVLAEKAGLFHRSKDLPSLFYSTCYAGSPSFMVISSQGQLARCSGIINDDSQIVGNVAGGVTHEDYWKSWTQFADPPKCRGCAFFPSCVLIEKCPGKGECFLKETRRQYEEIVKRVFKRWADRNINLKGEMEHGFSGTESGICTD